MENVICRFPGTINKKGKLRMFDSEEMIFKISEHPETNIDVLLVKREGSFTHQMRKYYFTVVVPEIQKAYWYLGEIKSKSDIDYMMREKGLFKETWNDQKGEFEKEVHTLQSDVTEVTFSQFMEYIHFCIRFAIINLDWPIMYPNEQFDLSEMTESQAKALMSSKIN